MISTDSSGPDTAPAIRLERDRNGFRVDVVALPNGGLVAEIAGDLDYLVTPAVRRRLVAAMTTQTSTVVLDLSHVTLLSAAAIEMLLDLQALSTTNAFDLRVVAAHRGVIRPLQLTGVEHRLALYPAVDAALSSL